jgi:UDP-N-acetylglucosamine transferase subunit ALG13
MIFATVGSALPFDRFIKAIDEWAALNPSIPVNAQIGAGKYVPKIAHQRMMSPKEFSRCVNEADLIVAHAGMGSVIMAAEARKPIVLMPRRAALGEHTTDHQIDTVGWLKERSGVYVAMEVSDLGGMIIRALEEKKASLAMGAVAPQAFISRIRSELMS